ncbi:hypothetical protein OSB04_un001620 [Centaurea solstitialis]|uniref:Uncharacterized protein n=1 Tax=Centaurea solstitialis TaxID=347529 RepID=A0AA38VQQ5_9ASTR|nr:hypothetical protein OSB04_un001620 [Centaurea solstitialis]
MGISRDGPKITTCFERAYLVWIVHAWTVVGVGALLGFPIGIHGEEDQVGPCERLMQLSPFNLLSEMRQKEENPMDLRPPHSTP